MAAAHARAPARRATFVLLVALCLSLSPCGGAFGPSQRESGALTEHQVRQISRGTLLEEREGLSTSATSTQTELARQLLSPQRYDKRTRPGGIEPLIVSVDTELGGMWKIDEFVQTYTLETRLGLQWTDERLMYDADQHGITVLRVHENEIWLPDLYFANQVVKIQSFSSVKVLESGLVNWVVRYTAVYRSEMDYRWFPFDEQKLYTSVQSYSYPSSELQIVPRLSEVSMQFWSPTWRVVNFQTFVSDTGYAQGLNSTTGERIGENVPVIRNEVTIQRRSQTYMYRIIMPLTAFTLTAFLATFLPRHFGNARIVVSVTHILVVVTLSISLRSQLPGVDYINWTDSLLLFALLYHVLCTLFVFFVSVMDGVRIELEKLSASMDARERRQYQREAEAILSENTGGLGDESEDSLLEYKATSASVDKITGYAHYMTFVKVLAELKKVKVASKGTKKGQAAAALERVLHAFVSTTFEVSLRFALGVVGVVAETIFFGLIASKVHGIGTNFQDRHKMWQH